MERSEINNGKKISIFHESQPHRAIDGCTIRGIGDNTFSVIAPGYGNQTFDIAKKNGVHQGKDRFGRKTGYFVK